MLRDAVFHVFDLPVWQSAILTSPRKAEVDRFRNNPWTPSLHWTEGAPPRLLAFVGTIVSATISLFHLILTLRQVSLCLDEWVEGERRTVAFHQPSDKCTYKCILKHIEEQWAGMTKSAQESDLVVIFG